MTGEAAVGARIHVVRFAPAKLNLTLAVVGRRDDGYHALHSVMVQLALGDALTVSETSPGAMHDTLRVSGLALDPSPDNLVLRAIAGTRAAVVAAAASAAARPAAEDRPQQPWLPTLAARLAKRVPVAAGLGGGSSDAAAAIDAALAAWSASLGPDPTAALAASLGSDVPFFLAHGAALVTGRGEFVEPLPDIAAEPPAVLLVTPRLRLATPAVFGAYSGGRRQPDPTRAHVVSERLAADLKAGLTGPALLAQAADLAAANDLMAAALSIAPGLRVLVTGLEDLLGRPVGQSGSGPTLWALYATLAEARKAVRFVRLAVADGTLPAMGAAEPFVAATTIAGRHSPPVLQAGVDAAATIRPRTVHNG